MIFNFLNHKVDGCEHFKWAEVLWLPKWEVFAFPTPEEQINLKTICQKAEKIRTILHTKIVVTSGFRPGVYNAYINGANMSHHKTGSALDFRPGGWESIGAMNEARNMIVPYLEEMDIRMEKLSVASWIHIDLGDPGPTGNRYFAP